MLNISRLPRLLKLCLAESSLRKRRSSSISVFELDQSRSSGSVSAATALAGSASADGGSLRDAGISGHSSVFAESIDAAPALCDGTACSAQAYTGARDAADKAGGCRLCVGSGDGAFMCSGGRDGVGRVLDDGSRCHGERSLSRGARCVAIVAEAADGHCLHTDHGPQMSVRRGRVLRIALGDDYQRRGSAVAGNRGSVVDVPTLMETRPRG